MEHRAQKPRSLLFKDVIVQLDSAAGEAAEQGAQELCDYIEGTLIDFIETEMMLAELAEME
jgi:hypothetical protein